MKKKFNITGTCYPNQHYMMDNRAKLADVLRMVEDGEYFIINRPRQYGKTTTLLALYEQLKASADYLPAEMNFQGVDEKWHASDSAFATMFMRLLHQSLKLKDPSVAALLEPAQEIQDMDQLSNRITDLVHATSQKLVLLIDEVDASGNYDPFLRFLGMLRNKYLRRVLPSSYTFHSVVLAGVHDVKSLKLKVRGDEQAQYNSPWNIATDFEVDMSFSPSEIAPMLVDYAQAEQVEIPIESFAEKLYYYTSGYPFLVSKLCKILAEKILPKKSERTWTLDDLETAVQLLLRENNTLFDSLIKNLENHPELYQLVSRVILEGEVISFNPHEPTISLGRLYGVFKENGTVKVHNRIYEQVLYDYMIAKTEVAGQGYSFAEPFRSAEGLNMAAVLQKFQQFMHREHSARDGGFVERNGRLVFLAFLNPVLNGHGHAFKEVEISEEKRLDVVVTYHRNKYVIELKRWYGEAAHQRGLDQLAGYLDRQALDRGFLVIFEGQKEKSGRQEEILHRGKAIFAVWV